MQVLSFVVDNDIVNLNISDGTNWCPAIIVDTKYAQFFDSKKRKLVSELDIIELHKISRRENGNLVIDKFIRKPSSQHHTKVGDPIPLVIPNTRKSLCDGIEEDWFNESFNGNLDMCGEFDDNDVGVGLITSNKTKDDNNLDKFREKLTGFKIDKLCLSEKDIDVFAIDKYVIARAKNMVTDKHVCLIGIYLNNGNLCCQDP